MDGILDWLALTLSVEFAVLPHYFDVLSLNLLLSVMVPLAFAIFFLGDENQSPRVVFVTPIIYGFSLAFYVWPLRSGLVLLDLSALFLQIFASIFLVRSTTFSSQPGRHR